MQLYAFDNLKQLIFAKQAVKQSDYFCLECGSLVRLRGGVHRQNHFYHLQPTRSCRMSGKSMEHLQVQCYLQKILPEGECQLEHPFPQIGRIADVVWSSRQLIFEVQCSPISFTEVRARNRDYLTLGYQVIWIFHDQRFNQWKVSAAEMELRSSSYYFTNIDSQGQGSIYDQFDFVHQGIRRHRLGRLPINPRVFHRIEKVNECNFPTFVQAKLKNCLFYFEGDLIHHCLKEDRSEEMEGYLKEALRIEQSAEDLAKKSPIQQQNLGSRLMNCIRFYIVRPYVSVIQMLLEKACQ